MSDSWPCVGADHDRMRDSQLLDELVEERLGQETGMDRLQNDIGIDRPEADSVMDRLAEGSRMERIGEDSGMERLSQDSGTERLRKYSGINKLDKNCDLHQFGNDEVEDDRMELLGFGGEEEMEPFHGEENRRLHGEEEDPGPLQRSRCNTWPKLAHNRRNAPVTSSSDEHESVSTNSPTGSLRGGVIVHPLSPSSHIPHPLLTTPPSHPHLLQLQRSPSGSTAGGATLALVSEEGLSEGEDSHGDIRDGGGCGLGGISKYKGTSRRNPWGNYSYADLITQAIQSSPDCRLTLSQVYDWMISNIPYFRDKGDTNSSAGWKNSIRHNLSLHQKFVRVQNEGAGKSSWWTINPEAKVGPKPPRRRALSMETSRLEKQRARAKKRIESRLERASSSISVSSDLFPASPANYFQPSPEFSRHRTSSNASSCGRISPTQFRSRTLSNASSVGCNHNSPPSLVEPGPEYQDFHQDTNLPDIKLERDLDLDNIHLNNLNIDMFHEISVKEEIATNEDISADCQDQVHKVKILERREPNMINFFGQQVVSAQDHLQKDYVARLQDISQDQLQQDYAARRQDMGQDQLQRQQDLRRRMQARRPNSVVKLLEERKLEEMARIQQQARMGDMARIEEIAKIEEVTRMDEISRMEEAERIKKSRLEEESNRREEEAASEKDRKNGEMELLEDARSKDRDPTKRLPGEMSRQEGIFMKRERFRKKLMEVTLNQLKEKRVKIQRDNANISYSNKQSLLSACDIKIKLLVEELAKYDHLDDNRLLNIATQRELERIGESVLITEPMFSMSGGLLYGDTDSFMDTMDEDMDNNSFEFSSDFKPLASSDAREEDVEIPQDDLVQQVIDHELKMEGNLDFTRSELIMYEMREPPGVSWV